MFDVCRVSGGTDVFIRNSMKNIIKRLTVEENHSTVFQGPGADKTELSGAIKRVKIKSFFKTFPDLQAALLRTTKELLGCLLVRKTGDQPAFARTCCGGGRGCR